MLRYDPDYTGASLIDAPALADSLRAELTAQPALVAGLTASELAHAIEVLDTPRGLAVIAARGVPDLRRLDDLVANPPDQLAVKRSYFRSTRCFVVETQSGVAFCLRPQPLKWRIRKIVLPDQRIPS